jgi:hypothetical protein
MVPGFARIGGLPEQVTCFKVASVEWKLWMDDGEMSRAAPGRSIVEKDGEGYRLHALA